MNSLRGPKSSRAPLPWALLFFGLAASASLGQPQGETQAPVQPEIEQAPVATSSFALQAVFMQVRGTVQWKSSDSAPWQAAQVDQLLDQGARIRTGRGSSAVLRIGKNATAVVGSLTTLALAQLMEERGDLRTRVGLVHGKTDFKVDQVGLSNDFEVITPTSVISVRGTGYSVEWGALGGALVNSFDGNTIRAVEISYFNSGRLFQLDENAESSDAAPDPVIKAMFSTIGPPPLSPNSTDGSNTQNTADQGVEQDRFAAGEHSLQQALDPEGVYRAYASNAQITAFLLSQIPSVTPGQAPPIVGPTPPPPPPPPPPPAPEFLPAPIIPPVSTAATLQKSGGYENY